MIELLVVISIVAALTGILLPSLNRVRQQARALLGASNQREIVNAANFYAGDNDQRYPESVATMGTDRWNWAEPMMLTARLARSPRMYRSVSAYLQPYIRDARIVYCPSAPQRYEYLQDAWDAGDDWDNPQTPPVRDSVSGTYCLYWNYTGFLQDRQYLFKGPGNTAGGPRWSKLLVSDYFGFDHHRSPNSYGSCEKFLGASIAEGTVLSSAYWSGYGDDRSKRPEIKLHAGYTDGHVETYSSIETLTMKVIIRPETGEPYPSGDGSGPGDFFLPLNALH
ncbi:MAG: type II secretion system protein [Phycisphaerales bacterium]|nr:MAG: type II secretion system protein [Phycisphaerales bacterium]